MEEARHPIQVLLRKGTCHHPWAYMEGVLTMRYGQRSSGMDRAFCSLIYLEAKTSDILQCSLQYLCYYF